MCCAKPETPNHDYATELQNLEELYGIHIKTGYKDPTPEAKQPSQCQIGKYSKLISVWVALVPSIRSSFAPNLKFVQ